MTTLDAPVEIVRSSPLGDDAKWCVAQYLAELAQRFPESFEPEKSVSAKPEELCPPVGQFLLVRKADRAVGCGAVKTWAPGIGEIKRMWIAREQRGIGLGRRLLGALEAEAFNLDFSAVRLDTSAHLPEAIALYRDAGYVEIADYNGNAYAAHWFEKRFAP